MTSGFDDREVAREVFSEPIFSKLSTFMDLLRKWNSAINLVSQGSLASAWQRHVLDSAQIFNAAPRNAGRWADLGSGAGFPGAVVAIMASESCPDLNVILVESDLRKAEFLRVVSRETSVPMTVVPERIEKLAPLTADVLSARALAPLPQLCAFASKHLGPGGTAIFPKGAAAKDEVAAARQLWRFDIETLPSATDPTASILLLKGISNV